MATYTILVRSDEAGYDIAVVADNGSRHTMLGFRTQAEVEAWIAADKAGSIADATPNRQAMHC